MKRAHGFLPFTSAISAMAARLSAPSIADYTRCYSDCLNPSGERTPSGTLRTTVNTYTYSGQPLKSTVTEGSVTTVTENTYHAASGLLTATDVTVNGVKQRVSAVEYDDLGRVESVTHGAASASGGKVSYRYNLHGQTTEIKGPGLTQNLFYADGPGNKLYNGSVSAMTWTMGTDTRVRGYKYSYNGYGWLTEAVYGEHSDIGTNPNRYTERFLEFMPNGGVRRLQRHGLKADGVYGKVDNLHISYDGNRITGVLDDAAPVTQNGSMDFPVYGREAAFEYNEWGALIKDESRSITDITYDRFGNPLKVSYSDGSYTENVYSAAGEKLKAMHATTLNGTVTGKTTTEYRGNVIYRDGKVDMVLFPGGYATVNGTAVTFHYYTQDYLGNNRAVINGSTGAIEQLTAYYPYGGVIADLGTPTTGQPYRFGGKELITANGLNEYDFGARQYYQAVPHFTKPDPMSEKYYWLSPYLYCGNDPINAIDPSGKIVIGLDELAQQNIINTLTSDEAKYVRFNDDGAIDTDLLNQSSSTSENFEALKTVVNSDISYYLSTASQYRVRNEITQMQAESSKGVVGTTLLPNAKHEPSPDENVHIYVSNRLPEVEMVSTTAHELFGHGYFYELKNQGHDVNPVHDMQNVDGGLEYIPEMGGYFPSIVRADVNYKLVEQIKTVTNQARNNYLNRIKK